MILKVRDNLLIRSLKAEDAPKVYMVIDNNRVYLRKWLPWVTMVWIYIGELLFSMLVLSGAVKMGFVSRTK